MTALELRLAYERTLPEWFEVNRKYNLDLPVSDLNKWLDSDVDTHASIKRYHFEMQFWHLRAWQAQTLAGTKSSDAELGLATRCLVASFIFCVPIYLRRPNNRQTVSIDWWALSLAQSIAVGWKEHAELQARLGFEQLNHVLNKGITGHAFPYFIMDLTKSWLDADVDTATSWRTNRFPHLGPWDELLKGWREPKVSVFKVLLDRLASYHLDQSREARVQGHDEDPNHIVEQFEVEENQYWLFPVLLFSVLSLREWIGLSNPVLDHALFEVSPLGKPPRPVPYPVDPLLDAAEVKYRSIFPSTPSLSALPELRIRQARPVGRA